MGRNEVTEEGSFLEAKLRTFGSVTLQDNWYEDRLQAPEDIPHEKRLEASRSRIRIKDESIGKFVGFDNVSQPIAPVPPRQRHELPKTSRTMPADVKHRDFTSTYNAMMKGDQQPPRTQKLVKMVQGSNYYHEVHTLRKHPTLPEKGFGGVLPTHPNTHNKVYFDTTYKAFFEDKPAEARAQPGPPEQGDDSRYVGGYAACLNPNAPDKGQVFSDSRGFFYTQSLPRDTKDQVLREEPPRGKIGSRGELIRDPKEAGSKSELSTYKDEYARTP
mmetsp:Transcript_26431/g.50191  ORF Transcript_26431/g.50191 Transcript_26431/m.50191 type:complete len:273 (+) Transcript_26431:111-929(+)|eukprot:CAMPEP_0114228294 /NCGR_PEP_ID=MMETSP0058-20121206/2261_1 /TAXON_ID=36894 /ORGANISM="Pyramimonas parkeae, CCMP726" /LENGTH=272 /DNA_ID=CAMNT_0001339221 /DNA_START=100 /DNA_END=918 /DNA_ORIENTATION=-